MFCCWFPIKSTKLQVLSHLDSVISPRAFAATTLFGWPLQPKMRRWFWGGKTAQKLYFFLQNLFQREENDTLSRVSMEHWILWNVSARKWRHLKPFQLQLQSEMCQCQTWDLLKSMKNPTFELSWAPLLTPSASSLICLFHFSSCLHPVLKTSLSLSTQPFPPPAALICVLQSSGINSSWVHIKYLMEIHEALRDLSESVSGKINQTRMGKIWMFENGNQSIFSPNLTILIPSKCPRKIYVFLLYLNF